MSTITPDMTSTDGFVALCTLDDLVVERGVAALLPRADGQGVVQVALFRMIDDTVFAVQQYDPFADANVMARGLVGTHSDEKLGMVDEPIVSSPMYKQVWSLRTGQCLDAQGKQSVDVRVFEVRLDGSTVLVRAA